MTRAVLVAVSLSAGCGSETTADKIELTLLRPSVDVDTLCVTETCLTTGLPVRVGFAAGEYVGPGEYVDILQYRVDYEPRGAAVSLPYFASPASFGFGADESVEEELSPAGYRQREAVRAGDTQEVAGTALLTLAGYDAAGDQVLLEAEFEVRFAPGSGGSGDAAMATEESTP